MAYIDALYEKNFLEYASYVIKDRAIPNLEDGLKPVQRRILHALYEMDDGKFHKVANVVGQTMKFHPHGDMSIYSALVVLGNKELFIDKQGNFGNTFTGDEASAARYIECRLTSLARETLFNPEITDYEDSYDGRSREPVTFPAKIPVLLAHGSEGIAVGMSTRVLPHNLVELLEAQIAVLQRKKFQLFPDFLTGGQVDVSEYADGNGKVLVRAKLDTRDAKRIFVRELPFGSTTSSLIASVEDAARKNKIKIAGVSDYTADKVEIEIRLARGVQAQDTVDALYAFTDCEASISISMMVIKDSRPHITSVTDAIKTNTKHLTEVLKAELKIEEGKLRDRLHAKTLEQIFIENRIYKHIEKMTTSAKVTQAVLNGLVPFESKIKRKITRDDVDTLLKIPIRRISVYDINRAKKEMEEICKLLRKIKANLNNLWTFAISFLKRLIEKYGSDHPRMTEIVAFDKVDAREAAQRNLKLRYDKASGYLGHEVNGNVILDASIYDRVLVIRKTGAYSVHDVPGRMFVDKGMLFCGFLDPERTYNIIYKDAKSGHPYLKRCRIDKYILNRGYVLIPEGCSVLKLTTDPVVSVTVDYKPKPRIRILQEEFEVEDFPVRGTKAKGFRLAAREVKTGSFA